MHALIKRLLLALLALLPAGGAGAQVESIETRADFQLCNLEPTWVALVLYHYRQGQPLSHAQRLASEELEAQVPSAAWLRGVRLDEERVRTVVGTISSVEYAAQVRQSCEQELGAQRQWPVARVVALELLSQAKVIAQDPKAAPLPPLYASAKNWEASDGKLSLLLHRANAPSLCTEMQAMVGTFVCENNRLTIDLRAWPK